MRNFFITFLLCIITCIPLVTFAADSGLIFCNVGDPDPITGKFQNACTFNSLIELVDRIIDFVVKIATLFAAIGLIRAGFLLITDQGSEKNVQKAKDLVVSIAKGFFFILCAWIIVNTIVSALVRPDSMLNFLEK